MKVLLGVIFLGFFVKSIRAIECYECADCRVPFDADDDGVKKKECEHSSCMKLNITHRDRFSIVSRGCGGKGMAEEGCDTKEVSGTASEICYCNSDECNGTADIKLNFTVGMLVIIILTPVFIMKCVNL